MFGRRTLGRRSLYNMSGPPGFRLGKTAMVLLAIVFFLVVMFSYGWLGTQRSKQRPKYFPYPHPVQAVGPHHSSKQRHKTPLKMSSYPKGKPIPDDVKNNKKGSYSIHGKDKHQAGVAKTISTPTVDDELYEDVEDLNESNNSEETIDNSLKELKQYEEEFKKRTKKLRERYGVWNDPQTNDSAEYLKRKLVVMYPVSTDLGIEENKRCGNYGCTFTFNISRLGEADAVLVDGYTMSQTRNRIKPVRTSPEQSWIYYSKMPWTTYRHSFPYSWNSVFNWTFTFDRASNFIESEAELVHMESDRTYDWTRIMKFKTKKILWIADECQTNSRREEYVMELQKHIPVDIVGKCGSKCVHGVKDVDDDDDDDDKDLCFRQYMFYLSFEDTLCKDYVTNNFFKTFSHHIVPIVRGGMDYKVIYPSNLYINTEEFSSPKLLADYLIHLIRDQTEYLGYLHRRVDFAVSKRVGHRCMICYHLHHLNMHRNSYHDISRWLDKCEPPKDLHANTTWKTFHGH